MTNLEQLKKETNEITNSLRELKNNVSLSEIEKKDKVESLKTRAESMKQKIQNEIHSLESKTDDISKKKKEKAEALLSSFTEITTLYASIIEKWTTNVPSTTSQPETESKGVFWKASDWVWEQWSDVWSKEKREKESWKNLLRTTWFVATWVWAVALAYKWIKKLFWWGKDKEEKKEDDEKTENKSEKEEKWFWDRPFGKFLKWAGTVLWIWSGVYYVGHGFYTGNWHPRDLFDWEKWRKLTFDEAMNYCKSTIVNDNKEESASYGIELQYHEDTSEIEAYGQRIKINKNSRRIEWLEVWFTKYEHLIDTAIVIAYLKKYYAWRCSTEAPFKINGGFEWDIEINPWSGDEEVLDWTWNLWRTAGIWIATIGAIINTIHKWLPKSAIQNVLWIAAWYWAWQMIDQNNFMHEHMPELDDEAGKKALISYLHWMNCWKAERQSPDAISESPIKWRVAECMEEIQKENPEFKLWWVRQLNAVQDSVDKNKYRISAYGREIVAEVTWSEGNEEIKILSISWWHPTIEANMNKSGLSNIKLPLKEWIYMSCLIWFLLYNKDIVHKWVDYPRFSYTSRGLWFQEWVYFNNAKVISIDHDTRVLSKEKFESRMPTLFKEENRDKFIAFLNDWIIDKNNKNSIRENMTN